MTKSKGPDTFSQAQKERAFFRDFAKTPAEHRLNQLQQAVAAGTLQITSEEQYREIFPEGQGPGAPTIAEKDAAKMRRWQEGHWATDDDYLWRS